jgi:AAA domain
MIDLPPNPYRTDYPGSGSFFGRASEIALLVESMRTGRQSLAAVMGGRGMGKTSLAMRAQSELGADPSTVVHFIRKASADPLDFLSQIAVRLGQPLDPTLPVESLVLAVRASAPPRVVLIADEIDGLLASEPGRSLVESLRIAWEELEGKLGLVVFGGSALRGLLSGGNSPFLRAARWLPLKGLSLEEAAALIREPLHLEVPDALVEVLWEQTGGHPLMLQAILERAVALGAPVVERLSEAVQLVAEERLAPTLFPIWWDNLGEGGQAIYQALLAHRRPIERHDQARVLGHAAQAWIEVLETTGVARSEGGQALPRCELFRLWVEENHPRASHPPPASDRRLPEVLRSFGAHPFEEMVVSAVTRWSRSVVEYPTWALRSGRASGNARLLPEQYFQLSLVTALHQRDLLVEAEGLSSAGGRADVKARWPPDPARRACTEIKIWGRNDYRDVVAQVLGYTTPEDDFACVVMIDRQARSLRAPYREDCLVATGGAVLWPSDGTETTSYPAFVTRHERASGRPLRVYHFIVQLPPDDA